ncbi:hypothetical protein ACMC9I_10830 [Deinococcota bacterium DY0809b]
MQQESKSYPAFGQSEVNQVFEIDFDSNHNPPLDDDKKRRIHQELMSLEW